MMNLRAVRRSVGARTTNVLDFALIVAQRRASRARRAPLVRSAASASRDNHLDLIFCSRKKRGSEKK